MTPLLIAAFLFFLFTEWYAPLSQHSRVGRAASALCIAALAAGGVKTIVDTLYAAINP